MSEPLSLITHRPEQTIAVGAAVARVAEAGDVIALVGELGAGKTQFVRGLASGMGIDPRVVSSPTFVFVQEYEPGDGQGPVLVHIDAYRLSGPDDLPSIGWTDEGAELRDGAITAVEWADRIEPALPADRLDVAIVHDEAGRRLTLSPRGGWGPKMQDLARELDATDKREPQDS